MSFESIGTKVDEIPVKIAYRIIQLFSAGLYSSPNKAFEELVSNSYDALASKVAVYVPTDRSVSNAIMWICDNGDSMDSNGLKLLWKIGYSIKRDIQQDGNERKPIGKFGIGKLATYVLARKLTYICKKGDEFRAVTMDYGKIDEKSQEPTEIKLEERLLTEHEAMNVLSPLVQINGTKLLDFNLWGRNAEDSWTFAIMSDLKPKAAEIQDGRLTWILSTALPLNPKFQLFFNGRVLQSSKADLEPIKTWIFGKDDEVIAKSKMYTSGMYDSHPCVNLPSLNNVYGQLDLYRDALDTGKSEKLGRSHGIFLMVRGRLVNTDDPLLGMPQVFNLGVFSRVRITVHADGLDDYLTSTRESIMESPALAQLQDYIKKKFDEARSFHSEEEERIEKEASHKVSQISAGLSRRPLLVVAKKFFDGTIDSLMFIDIPRNLSDDEKKKAIAQLELDLTSETGIIKDVVLEALKPESPIASLDLLSGKARINVLHPFFANLIEEVKSILPFKLIATTEILTEAFMIESGIRPEFVREIMLRRDRVLRDMTFSSNLNTPRVAQLLGESLSNATKLEEAVFHVFNNLGFETTRIGGNGKPDGTAVARLGVRYSGGPREDYTIVYDAKSTSKDKIKAQTAHIAGLVRHKTDYQADFGAIIAIDYEGAMDGNSAISREANKHKITLIRASDLMRLVLLASPRQIGLRDLKEFFEKCHTVKETSEWISEVEKREIKKEPVKELLEATYKLTVQDKEPPDLNAIRQIDPILNTYSIEKLIVLVNSIRALVGNLISIEGTKISIQAPPRKILEIINKNVSDVPPEVIGMYLEAFKTE